jgi:hypothetical protein
VSVAPELLDRLVGELTELLAPRVAAELAARMPMPTTAGQWRLLDVEEAAAAFGRSTRWVRERAKRGDLPYIRLDGGGLAFEVDDLRAFTASRRVSADSRDPLAGRLHVLGDPAPRAGSRVPDRVDGRRVAR